MYENIYLALHVIIAPAWALLAFAPGWVWTRRIVHASFFPLVLGAIYLVFLSAGIFFGQSDPDTSMSSISGVSALFSHPVGVLTGWTHYLVFDLFVGAWIARDALRAGLNKWIVLPALVFTLMLGPLGLALYLLIRKVTGKGGWSLVEG
ncbi:ABA4-like family protein [Hyphobacterium sp.]|uniref:ABA4-like family protein n=1 Tax=Hyphobacterium sp. TaxID=2004662 RepID=UPI003B51A93C